MCTYTPRFKSSPPIAIFFIRSLSVSFPPASISVFTIFFLLLSFASFSLIFSFPHVSRVIFVRPSLHFSCSVFAFSVKTFVPNFPVCHSLLSNSQFSRFFVCVSFAHPRLFFTGSLEARSAYVHTYHCLRVMAYERF